MAILGLCAAVLLLVAPAGAGTAAAADPATEQFYNAATGHNLMPPFKPYYDSHGGIDIFGYPLTEAYEENGRTVQYFERARFEIDPATGAVQLGLLGKAVTDGQPARTRVTPIADSTDRIYCPETGHSVSYGFLACWRDNGGADAFGYPISEEEIVDGVTTQYFQYARFQALPEGIRVRLLDNQRGAGSPFAAVSSSTSSGDRWYFPETGHTLSYGFLTYWKQHGGLEQFGFPITEETKENGLTVQYFERARFEYHPEFQGTPYETELGHLGREYAVMKGLPADKTAPAMPMELVGRGTSRFLGSTPERAQNIAVASSKFNGVMVPDGAIFSFNETIGPIDEAHGYAPGWVIIGDRTVKGIGGGVCQVSTTAFRAAFFSGLEMVSRTPHAYRVGWYEPPVGLDATVYEGSTDFKFKNTLGSPLYMTTFIDNNTNTLYFSFYGKKPSYTVELDGPYLSNWVAHGPDKYEYDPTMSRGQKIQTESAVDGLDATVYRVFKEDGVVTKKERFFSHYEPWQAMYKVGTE